MTQANTTYSIKSWTRKAWESQPAAEDAGAQLMRLELIHVYKGDLEGEGIVQHLVADNGNHKGSYIGLEKITGSLGGRSGSFVFQHTGAFDNGKIRVTLAVVPGSGMGELSGLSGQTTLEFAQHQDSYPITFDYAVQATASAEV